jgi:hypothetical protein
MCLENYRVALINMNFTSNKYVGEVNRPVNDLKDLQRQSDEAKKISVAEDVTDIERKILKQDMKVTPRD